MLELMEWAANARFSDRPWLLLGKGPTFGLRHQFDLSHYNLMALNHVVNELKVDVAHIIDIDVAKACSDRLAENCDWLVMPRHPHIQMEPQPDHPLEALVEEIPALRRLDEENRLVWYNAASGKPVGDSPVIGFRYFSSEIALNILAKLGVKTVRSLGIDGGRSYSAEFESLRGQTLLANSQPTFDLQFAQIDAIAKENGVDYRPLVDPLKIFVGTDESQMVATRVLEYTIRKFASRPVEFVPMLNFPVPLPKDPQNQPRTGFSFCRFLIPKLAGYSGRALYLDADMQVFGDIAELWDIPFGQYKALCTVQNEGPAAWEGNQQFHPGRQLSVMLLDCERLGWDIDEIVRGLDEGTYTYEQLMFELCVIPPDDIGDTLPVEWNQLERFQPGKTKLLHYTVVPTQPWKNDENPLQEIWMSAYREAVEAGAVPPEEVEALIKARHVKPSLGAALSLAPSRRSALTTAARDQATAAVTIKELEAEVAARDAQLAALRQELDGVLHSTRLRVGTMLVEPLSKAKRVLRRP